MQCKLKGIYSAIRASTTATNRTQYTSSGAAAMQSTVQPLLLLLLVNSNSSAAQQQWQKIPGLGVFAHRLITSQHPAAWPDNLANLLVLSSRWNAAQDSLHTSHRAFDFHTNQYSAGCCRGSSHARAARFKLTTGPVVWLQNWPAQPGQRLCLQHPAPPSMLAAAAAAAIAVPLLSPFLLQS